MIEISSINTILFHSLPFLNHYINLKNHYNLRTNGIHMKFSFTMFHSHNGKFRGGLQANHAPLS